MMRYCLDTSVVIDLLRGVHKTEQKLRDIPGIFCINPIILCEIYKGVYGSRDVSSSLAVTQAFFMEAEFLSFSEEACVLFGKIFNTLKRKGKPTGEFDLLIGCIALAHHTTLVTKNSSDFKHITGLQILAID